MLREGAPNSCVDAMAARCEPALAWMPTVTVNLSSWRRRTFRPSMPLSFERTVTVIMPPRYGRRMGAAGGRAMEFSRARFSRRAELGGETRPLRHMSLPHEQAPAQPPGVQDLR